MTVYIDLVILLNFGVDFLLLVGSNQLSGHSGGYKRMMIAALIGATYAGVCTIPSLYWLQGLIYRLLCLFLMAIIAFGCRRSAIRRSLLFVFLCFVLGGAASAFNRNDILSLIFSAALIALVCTVGFSGSITGRRYLPVEMLYRGKRCSIIVLVDTGNSLKDPVSGRQITVIGQDVASDLTGLTPQQIADPVQTVQNAPVEGLRLIPYHTVGRTAGLLLAAKMDQVMINGREVSGIVAFAPEKFQNAEGYQGLTGGIL